MHVKKGDIVKILTGDDKGKTGKILKAFPADNKVVIEGINVIKRHQRPTRQGQKGQIVEMPMPYHASNVVLADAAKAKPAKVVKAKPVKVAAKSAK
jgi:large subunit ribosomal protein L24